MAKTGSLRSFLVWRQEQLPLRVLLCVHVRSWRGEQATRLHTQGRLEAQDATSYPGASRNFQSASSIEIIDASIQEPNTAASSSIVVPVMVDPLGTVSMINIGLSSHYFIALQCFGSFYSRIPGIWPAWLLPNQMQGRLSWDTQYGGYIAHLIS